MVQYWHIFGKLGWKTSIMRPLSDTRIDTSMQQKAYTWDTMTDDHSSIITLHNSEPKKNSIYQCQSYVKYYKKNLKIVISSRCRSGCLVSQPLPNSDFSCSISCEEYIRTTMYRPDLLFCKYLSPFSKRRQVICTNSVVIASTK